MQAAPVSSFGEKLSEANCKVQITPQTSTSNAVAEIWTLGVLVKPTDGSTLFVAYTEVSKLEAANYRVSITASNGSTTAFSQFGIKFDNFANMLADSWGNALAKALLMEEPSVVYEARCFYAMQNPSETSNTPMPCRARIYQTSLLLLSSSTLPIRIPFSQIQSVDLQNFRVRVMTGTGVTYELIRLANATQLFVEKLREAMKMLEASSIETIKANLPSATFDELQKLRWLMVEGRAVPRSAVDRISPSLWTRLEKNIELSPIAESYRYISTIGISDLESAGLRKAKDNVYVWFMVPVFGSPSNGGNAVVMEVTSETGHATYLFRVMPRSEFVTTSAQKFSEHAASFVNTLNEAIIATGFRREPIYLTEDQLNTQEYSKYLYAADHLESLKILRERFFARIIHNSFDQWKTDLTEALQFNTNEKDETKRWSKSTLDFVESLRSAPLATEQIVTEVHPTQKVQTLNEEVSSGQSMPEKIVLLSQMHGDDNGNVKLLLHDNDFDQDIWIMISGEDASKLGAFPGTKLKLSLQKNA